MRPARHLLLATLAAVAVGLLTARPGAGASGIGVTVTLDEASTRIVLTPPNQSARRNTKVIYLFRVQNATGTERVFSLATTCSARWKATLPANPKGRTPLLSPGEVTTVPVEVTVPRLVAIGSTGWTTLTATSVGKAKVSDQGTVITTVVATLGLSLTMEEAKTARAGERVRYRVTVTNETDQPQQVTLRAESGHGWAVKTGGKDSETFSLPAGGSVEVVCEVTVPPDAAPEPDAVIVSAETQTAPPVQAAGVTTLE
jgi:uncharacterized membrane protein